MPLTHSPAFVSVELETWTGSRRTRHVAVTTAGVAGLASGVTAEAAAVTTTTTTVGVAEAGLGAVTGNVADLTTLYTRLTNAVRAAWC